MEPVDNFMLNETYQKEMNNISYKSSGNNKILAPIKRGTTKELNQVYLLCFNIK